MLFPIPFLLEKVKVPFNSEAHYRLRDSVKFALFFDNGAVFPHEGKATTTNFLSSVGAGMRITISKFLTAWVYVGMTLMNTALYNQANARIHFDLVVSPF